MKGFKERMLELGHIKICKVQSLCNCDAENLPRGQKFPHWQCVWGFNKNYKGCQKSFAMDKKAAANNIIYGHFFSRKKQEGLNHSTRNHEKFT